MIRTTLARRARVVLASLFSVALLAALMPGVAAAQDTQHVQTESKSPRTCNGDSLDSTKTLLQCVNAADAFRHLKKFQQFADENGGTRASGTPGYDASADYVAELMEAAGLDVERQEFEFTVFTEISSSLTADGADVETQTMSFSGSGTIDAANVIAVDLDLGPGNSSSSGCEPTDFDGLDFSGDNDLALMQRGACAFGDKAVNAEAAGAEAAIIFNQGDTDDPGRQDIINGTLGVVVGIPVLDLSYANGLLINDATDVGLAAETTNVTSTTENIIADMPGANPDNVVMAGAHLDSVEDGPGVQDNGSGSAALLGIALELAGADYTPNNTLRFAWWGAEESGLIGSNEYVFNPDFGLTDPEYDALALYLNFDMVASPNYIFGVYDADQSSFEAPVPVPEGSEAIEDVFEAYYSRRNIPYDDSEFSGRSDYQAFIDVGIPAGGLFTGAEEIKTDAQVALWGGTAGDQFDPCYHIACDTIDNVSRGALNVNIDAIAYAIFNFAGTTEAVNGVAGIKPNGIDPDKVRIDGPAMTFAEGGGGHNDHVRS